MSEEEKLIQELKDHFPDVLYGVHMHFWHIKDVHGPINTEIGSIDKKTTAFEMCRSTIVRDVVSISDKQPEYIHYHFVVAECTEDYIRIARTAAKSE